MPTLSKDELARQAKKITGGVKDCSVEKGIRYGYERGRREQRAVDVAALRRRASDVVKGSPVSLERIAKSAALDRAADELEKED